MFALIALILFVLAAFGVSWALDIVALGLAFVAMHLLVGNWPFGTFRIGTVERK